MQKKLFFCAVFVLFCGALSFSNTLSDSLYKSNVVASYYADKFHGRKTSNGETFNMWALTAAHKTLPFNTLVRVTNLSNGKSVVVRINDRGHFVSGREIDLSKAAASQLDMIKSGTARVSLAIVSDPCGTSGTSLATKSAEKWEKPFYSTATHWDIQLGSFSKKENAEAFAKKAYGAGVQNLAYQTPAENKAITRVVVKNVPTEKVLETLRFLESKGFYDYLVRERK